MRPRVVVAFVLSTALVLLAAPPGIAACVTPANVVNGDANGDGAVTISDVFFAVNYLYAGGPPPGAFDANLDTFVNASDVVYVVNHLLAGGPRPVFTQLPAVGLDFDPAMATTMRIGPEGGGLVLHNYDGTLYALDIPPGALSEPLDISMTPLSAVCGLPLSGWLEAGVKLDPDGLTFALPVTLQIIPSGPNRSLYGFSTAGDGTHFRLEPYFQSILSLTHFSTVGLASGATIDCAPIINMRASSYDGVCPVAASSGATIPDLEQQRIACLTSGAADIRDIDAVTLEKYMLEWFDLFIDPLLQQAFGAVQTGAPNTDTCLEDAIRKFMEWRVIVQGFGIEYRSAIQARQSAAAQKLVTIFNTGIAKNEAACLAALDAASRAKAYRALATLLTQSQLLGLDSYGVAPTDYPGNTCGTITLSPASLSLNRNESAPIQAILRDGDDRVPAGATVTWSSSEPLIASVSSTGVVTANSGGSATIRATWSRHTAESSVTVLPGASPTLDGISPSVVCTNGGAVSLYGDNFYPGMTVKIGGVNASWTWEFSDKIRVVAPPHEMGTVDVEVFNTDGGYAKRSNLLYYFPYSSSSEATLTWTVTFRGYPGDSSCTTTGSWTGQATFSSLAGRTSFTQDFDMLEHCEYTGSCEKWAGDHWVWVPYPIVREESQRFFAPFTVQTTYAGDTVSGEAAIDRLVPLGNFAPPWNWNGRLMQALPMAKRPKIKITHTKETTEGPADPCYPAPHTTTDTWNENEDLMCPEYLASWPLDLDYMGGTTFRSTVECPNATWEFVLVYSGLCE